VFLAIDVGNTNTVLGIYDPRHAEHGGLLHHFRIATNRAATSDEVAELVLSLVERRKIPVSQIKGSILASVVPQLNRVFVEACHKAFGAAPVVVGPGIKTGMPILVDQPNEVGADRIVNAVAGFARYKQALVIVDFGTGTTFDAVTAKGEYVGGAIAPGIDISMDALFSRAAKLPRVELKQPPKVIGKNTVNALQSGLLFGYAGLVDELVSRMQVELGTPAKVVATGGLAFLFEGISRTLEIVDEFLTLDGLRILYDLNTKRDT
jgi:type III pantothenate kinase